jgi:hypothetical protein
MDSARIKGNIRSIWLNALTKNNVIIKAALRQPLSRSGEVI